MKKISELGRRVIISDNSVEFRGRAPSFEELLASLCRVILGMAIQVKGLAKTSTEDEELTRHIYDMMNETFSTVLAQFAPALEHAPEFDIDDVMSLQNSVMELQPALAKVVEKAEPYEKDMYILAISDPAMQALRDLVKKYGPKAMPTYDEGRRSGLSQVNDPIIPWNGLNSSKEVLPIGNEDAQ